MVAHEEETPETYEEKEFYDQLREKLILLSEKGEIKQSIRSIKKASKKSLLGIKSNYEAKKFEMINKLVVKMFLEKLSEFLKKVELIESETSLSQELLSNELLQKDLENLMGYITPWIPLMGLGSGIVIV